MTTAESGGVRRSSWDGWQLRETGPDGAPTALLLPGGMCTAAFYDDVLALAGPELRLVAATPPGFGGLPAPDDVSVEAYAWRAATLAGDVRADVVVGHSHGANVAIEMAAQGLHPGPFVLLSPCFSRRDEERDLRLVDMVSRVPVVGRMPWMLLPRVLDASLRGHFPAARHDALLAEMRASEPDDSRRIMSRYFDHLDRHGSLVARLRDSGVRVWVVRGDHDGIGLTAAERRGLLASPRITLVTVPDAGHFVLTDQPAATFELVREALRA
jgi:pimeloyl-ACP methyl ester carboxylesterase